VSGTTVRVVWQVRPDTNVYASEFNRDDFEIFTDRTTFLQAAGTVANVNFDQAACGTTLNGWPPVAAGNVYANLGLTFASGQILQAAGFAASTPNVIAGEASSANATHLLTPEFHGSFAQPVYAVGFTNIGPGADMWAADAAGTIIGTAQTDADLLTADFLGVVSVVPIASFGVSGTALAADDLVFTSLATPDCTPPVITVTPTPPIVVPATSSSGAVVTYAVTATDTIDANPRVSCLPASGSVFPIGTTTVGCTASDASGNIAGAGFLVTVVDSTPPVITVTSTLPIVVPATSASGAVVTYAVTATDTIDANPRVSCLPASGSVFPIGATTVGCTAIDASANSSGAGFIVTVTGAPEQLTTLISVVRGLNLQQGITNSLDAKLANADAALTAAQAGDLATACGLLNAFITEVQAQSGKKITAAQASQLLAAATQIKAVLGCP
jgi:hypothetical protein